ncbi:HAD-like protein [Dendrothele bispora CBS 962.96]|uniref:HAD-like protein n=1 Tax=Dendrothele bispora (strain CBS 962.96) TaxID=1314807 RepID=A0A4S8LN97_DENBC|nr:HAD-like protein [Dendrothele bispora CBS 962.96]
MIISIVVIKQIFNHHNQLFTVFSFGCRTLIDSTPGLVKAWETFCRDYNLGDPAAITHATHGRRLYDTLKDVCAIEDEEKLLSEIDRFEEEVIRGGPVALPGAVELLLQLNSDESTRSRWTIVTSATNYYAPRALQRCGIPLPIAGIVTSNDVTNGKPHPEPYTAGASKCNVASNKCLVIEDAVSGLNAGRAAGAKTLAVCTSTTREKLVETMGVGNRPDFIVDDLTSIRVKWTGEAFEISIAEPSV